MRTAEEADVLGTLIGSGPRPGPLPTQPEDLSEEQHEGAPEVPDPLLARLSRGPMRFVLDLLLGATFMAVVHVFLVQISVVRGHSMEPSLHDGDRLVVDRVSYQVGAVDRNDIVVLRCPSNPRVDFVKRVVGLPGDRVEMRRGRLFVNGKILEGDYQPVPDDEELQPLVVPEGHYFVLGDNRPVSCDSREFGLVAEELLRGRVRVRFWPLDRLALF